MKIKESMLIKLLKGSCMILLNVLRIIMSNIHSNNIINETTMTALYGDTFKEPIKIANSSNAVSPQIVPLIILPFKSLELFLIFWVICIISLFQTIFFVLP